PGRAWKAKDLVAPRAGTEVGQDGVNTSTKEDSILETIEEPATTSSLAQDVELAIPPDLADAPTTNEAKVAEEKGPLDYSNLLLSDLLLDQISSTSSAATVRNEKEKREHRPFGSRSSSPVGYEGFVEPLNWTQKLIVQDPFVLTRNTALNVEPFVVDILKKVRLVSLSFICLTGRHRRIFFFAYASFLGEQEMARALELIEAKASISEVCASIKNDPRYKSLSKRRAQERQKRSVRNHNEKINLEKVIREGDAKEAVGASQVLEKEEEGVMVPEKGIVVALEETRVEDERSETSNMEERKVGDLDEVVQEPENTVDLEELRVEADESVGTEVEERK
ncbi:hypothetical protein P7C70_g6020, partial [Phenoliferia sp. Uapishka_3]